MNSHKYLYEVFISTKYSDPSLAEEELDILNIEAFV